MVFSDRTAEQHGQGHLGRALRFRLCEGAIEEQARNCHRQLCDFLNLHPTSDIQTPPMHRSSQRDTSNTLLKHDSLLCDTFNDSLLCDTFNNFSHNSSQRDTFNTLISKCNVLSTRYLQNSIYLNRTPSSLCSPLTLYQLRAGATRTNHPPLKKVPTKGMKPWSRMSMRLEQIMRYATLIFMSLPFKLKTWI